MANQHMSADKELFLDILTKEEREALLTKKMEEIRKKNEALRKRHEYYGELNARQTAVSAQEIEADKRQAEKMVKPSSPKKDIKTVDFNTGKKEEFHRHSGSDFEYLRSRTDFDYLRSRTDFELPFDGEVKRRQKASGRGKGPGGRGKERPKSLDENGGPHLEPPFRGRRSMHATIPGGGGGHRLERVATMPDQEMNEIHIQITANVPEHRSSFANSRQTRDKHRDRERERPADVNGPPPDPAYNFLADKRREGPAPERGDRDSGGGGGGGSSGRGGKGGVGGGGGGGGNLEDSNRDALRQKDHRRHPKNYGGTDFQNVKTKMKMAREKQAFTGSSPQSKMEMAISMTGRERRQYMEWKAERERVDKERIERQKSASGEWRREWDAEKHPQDFEEGSGVKRPEPNRRPAGRIGSGRFDRGERDDRQRGEAPGSKENAEQKRTKIGEKTDKGKKLLGRGRGRGRGISATPRNRILPPNLANDSRKVECTRDLLVVKIDNSPGAGDDVEVEYSDTDGIATKTASSISSSVGIAIPTCQSISHASATSSYSKSCPTHSSTAPAEKMWGTIQENSWDQSQAAKQNGERHHDDDDDEDVMLEDEYIEDGELYEGMYEDAENDPHYVLMHGMADGDDWEECAEDEDYYVDGNDLVYDDADKSREPLRVECQLNPEAPAFVPTSPELIKSPPGTNDNPKWGSEVTPNISKSSGGDTNNNEETPKDPSDNCCSSSSKLSSAIVEGNKVQDENAAISAQSSSSTSSFECDPGQDRPEAKSPASSALKADPEDKDSKDKAKEDTKPTNPISNESTKTMSTSVSNDNDDDDDDEEEEDEFKDTKEIFDDDNSKDNDNDNTKNQSLTENSNNNNNNNNNNKDNISTDSISEKTNTILEDENTKIQNNNSEKKLVKESSTVSSTEKISAEDNKSYSSSNTVHTVTVKETIQTVKDAGAWKLSVKDDVESLLMYKNQSSDIIESNSFDRSVSSVGSSGMSLANELLEAELGKSQTSLKTAAAHTTTKSSSTTSSTSSSSSSNQPITCQDSAPDASSQGTGTDGAKTEQPEVSDLSNAGPTKAEASL